MLSLHDPGYFAIPAALCAWKTPWTLFTSTILVVTGIDWPCSHARTEIKNCRAWRGEKRAGPACPKDWSSVGREEAVPGFLLFGMWVGKSCCCLAEDEFLMCFSHRAGNWALLCVLCQVLLQETVGWSNLEWIFSFKYISQMYMWQCALLTVYMHWEIRRRRGIEQIENLPTGIHTGFHIRNTFPEWL